MVLKSLIVISFMTTSASALDLVPIEFCVFGAVAPVPTNVAATDGTYTSKVVVTYKTSSCSSKYYIYRKISGYLFYSFLGTSTSGTYEDTTASLFTTYDYAVKGWNSNGYSDLSASDEGYVQLSLVPVCPATAPAAPTNIAASDGTYGDKIVLSGYGVSCATSYDIYRSTSLAGVKTKIADNTALTTYNDTSVTVGTTYYYFVKANNAWGTSDYSDPDTGTALTIVLAPGVPANFAASQGTYTDKIRLTWDLVSGADSYNIFRNMTGTGTFDQINWPGTAGNSFDDTGVVAGTTYYYLITAVKSGVESDISSVVSGYAQASSAVSSSSSSVAMVPDIPASVSASDGDYTDKVVLTISAVTGATQYDIYRSTDVADIGTKIGSSSSNLTADTSVVPGTYYYYRVQACNSDGCSDYSMPDSGHASASEPVMTIEEKVAAALITEGSYLINGSFGQHDFAGVDPAFDWAYTVAGGASYQLQGNPPTANDVFGWKEAAIPTPTAVWYMFAMGADIDEDGSAKFDWIMVSTNTNNKSVYKLQGVSASGNFEYSSAVAVDYSISGDGKTVTFTAP